MLRKIKTVFRYVNVKDQIKFIRNLVQKRKIVYQMARDEFKTKYLGSFLGVTWAFLQPVIFMAALWFVFSVGFKSGRTGKFPFTLYLMTGIVVYNFFSEGLNAGTMSIQGKSYLVKKIKFRVSLLPVVQTCTSLIIHMIFLVVILAFHALLGYFPDIYWLQIFYYLFALIVLVQGLSFIAASVQVFAKDVANIIQILTRIGVWFSPVFWRGEMFSPKVHFFLKLNPLYYILYGYREALLYKTWFWEHPLQTVYFWVLNLLILSAGIIVFKRLRPHFADVL